MLKRMKLNKIRSFIISELEKLTERKATVTIRQAEIEKALEEAGNDEDIKIVDESINELELEIADIDNLSADAETRLAETELELKSLDNKILKVTEGEMRGDSVMGEKFLEIRKVKTFSERKQRMREVFNHEGDKGEVRTFMESVQETIKTRGVLNSELLIPEVLINMIIVDMELYGRVGSLVNMQSIGGTARVTMSGDAPEAIWVDCCDPIPVLNDLDFKMIELDCYKLAGYLRVCNATIEDSFINLSAHIQEQMVKGYNKAVDRAILIGSGSAGKQLTGIVPTLRAENSIIVNSDFSTVLKTYALLNQDADVTAAVMTKNTYIIHFMPQTLQVNSAGQVVVASTKNPTLPDGTPVVYVSNNVIPDNRAIIGDFKKYFLAIRSGMSIKTSTEVKFIEDQTVFRIIGRMDGKPMMDDAFVSLTLQSPTPAKVQTSMMSTGLDFGFIESEDETETETAFIELTKKGKAKSAKVKENTQNESENENDLQDEADLQE